MAPRTIIKRNLPILVIVIAVSMFVAALLVRIISPHTGYPSWLSEENFFLYRAFGVPRVLASRFLFGLAYTGLPILLVGLFVYRVLSATKSRAVQILFVGASDGILHGERVSAAALATMYAVLFAILLPRNLPALADWPDLHWHATFNFYDLDWKTPTFSLSADILHQFGMQPPFNTSLSPLIGLGHAFPLQYRLMADITLFFVAVAALIWALGGTLGLRPVPRVILAGTIALMMTIPYGIDYPLPFVPPFYLMPNTILVHYWLEVGILSLASAYAYFWIGRFGSPAKDIAISVAFWAVVLDVLMAFPAAALFSIPVIGLYCLAFVITAENAKELLWKLGSGALLTVAMLLLHFPTFFRNLYDYCFGAYFSEAVNKPDPTEMLQYQTMATAFFNIYDLRPFLLIAVAVGAAGFLAVRGSGALRRFAIAALTCELGLIVIGCTIAMIIRYPVSMYYAENYHLPFLLSFLVLFYMFVILVVIIACDDILARIAKPENRRGILGWLFRNRLKFCFVVPVAVLIYCAAAVPVQTGQDRSTFPPAQPPSVKLLENELALKPGGSFRGRAYTLVGKDASIADTLTINPIVVTMYNVTEDHYGRYLGNDHWVDLLPFNIPVVNEIFQWPSAMTFAFLRNFFGNKADSFNRAGFFLRSYNERIARLIGIRIVITDAPTVPGGTLIYETMAGDEPLRLFRIDGTNLGQYSPTSATRVATATDALAALEEPSFDPERDVVVEDDPPADLVPGKLLSLTTEFGPILSIRAESPGRSLLVLPFEYSHCLRLKVEAGASARLVPVNLLQVGLLFQHQFEGEISYRFGPLDHPECRGDDIQRADRLELRAALSRLARQ
jgi:hypothetical protein